MTITNFIPVSNIEVQEVREDIIPERRVVRHRSILNDGPDDILLRAALLPSPEWDPKQRKLERQFQEAFQLAVNSAKRAIEARKRKEEIAKKESGPQTEPEPEPRKDSKNIPVQRNPNNTKRHVTTWPTSKRLSRLSRTKSLASTLRVALKKKSNSSQRYPTMIILRVIEDMTDNFLKQTSTVRNLLIDYMNKLKPEMEEKKLRVKTIVIRCGVLKKDIRHLNAVVKHMQKIQLLGQGPGPNGELSPVPLEFYCRRVYPIMSGVMKNLKYLEWFKPGRRI